MFLTLKFFKAKKVIIPYLINKIYRRVNKNKALYLANRKYCFSFKNLICKNFKIISYKLRLFTKIW
jgi:hypothetical protein